MDLIYLKILNSQEIYMCQLFYDKFNSQRQAKNNLSLRRHFMLKRRCLPKKNYIDKFEH